MTATVPPEPPPRERTPEARIAPMFLERWSRRAFSERPLGQAQVSALFEAARWAPSASNLQPWLFVYADDAETLSRARPVLFDSNRRWADKAPLLAFLFARLHHPRTGAPNRTAAFDTGAAWMALALQAHQMGLVAHAMGGIHLEAAHEVFEVPAARFTAICGIAVGYPGDVAELPDDLRAREVPSARRPSGELAYKGRYAGG